MTLSDAKQSEDERPVSAVRRFLRQCGAQFWPTMWFMAGVLSVAAGPNIRAIEISPPPTDWNYWESGIVNAGVVYLFVAVNLVVWPVVALLPWFARRGVGSASAIPRPPDVWYLSTVWVGCLMINLAMLRIVGIMNGIFGVTIATRWLWPGLCTAIFPGTLAVLFRYWRTRSKFRGSQQVIRRRFDTDHGSVSVPASIHDMDRNHIEYQRLAVDLGRRIGQYLDSTSDPTAIMDRTAVELAEKIYATRHVGMSPAGSSMTSVKAIQLPAYFYYLRYSVQRGSGYEHPDLVRAVELYRELDKSDTVPAEIFSRVYPGQRPAQRESSIVEDLPPSAKTAGVDNETVAMWTVAARFGDSEAFKRMTEVIRKLYDEYEHLGNDLRHCPLANKLEPIIRGETPEPLLEGLQDQHEVDLISKIVDMIEARMRT